MTIDPMRPLGTPDGPFAGGHATRSASEPLAVLYCEPLQHNTGHRSRRRAPTLARSATCAHFSLAVIFLIRTWLARINFILVPYT
jgi:hypothetical protein